MQSKNVLDTIMQSMAAIVVVTVAWIVLGFTLSFAPGTSWIGGLQYFFAQHVGFSTQTELSPHIPFALFMIFQLMFCTIAVSILSGSISEKMKFFPYLIFVFVWVIVVYSPVAHWVWGGGWIDRLGAIDYAGGTVVHISSGVSGLVLAMMIGAGRTFDKRPPHNLVISLIGAIMVWLGWYGFNVGSAYTFNAIAMTAFVNTVLGASAGALSWMAMEYLTKRTTSLVGMLSGVLAGLVTITPAAGYVHLISALILSGIGGIGCFFTINYIKVKLNYNDALDAFGLHGMGGIIGALLTGVFQSHQINSKIADGLLLGGNWYAVVVQFIAVAVTLLFSGIMTFLIAKIIGRFSELGTTEDEEEVGLDYIQHGERAYFYGELNKLNHRL